MKEKDRSFIKIKKIYLNFLNKQEVLGAPFYDKIGQLNKFYMPICDLIYKDYKLNKKNSLVIGLSGGQGSGKTTITQILKLILKNKFNLNVINFSIDDFYKTLSQRKSMSKTVHKLFLTRGVPGTHDINLLNHTFKKLFKKKFKSFNIPSFDKSIDDRKPKKKWNKITKKPDVIIFEGWCIGAKHENINKLKKSINILEKISDKNLTWRKKVNNELKNRYKKIFKFINKIIFLQVPSFEYVYKWRMLQEKKLKLSSVGSKAMNKKQIKNFVMYYERTTKQMLKDLKNRASVVISLDKKHRLSNIKFN